jgi:hypothetical protein
LKKNFFNGPFDTINGMFSANATFFFFFTLIFTTESVIWTSIPALVTTTSQPVGTMS